MHRLNKNIIVFVFAALFCGYGLWGTIPSKLGEETKKLYHNIQKHPYDTILSFRKNVESITTSDLYYHDQLVDLNSIRENLLGTRIIKKEDMTIAKTDQGVLLGHLQSTESSPSTVAQVTEHIMKIKQLSEENGAEFLYCLVPSNALYYDPPLNIEIYNRQNYQNLRDALVQCDIPFLDCREALNAAELQAEEVFFATDHHWTPLSGFTIYKAICGALNQQYGFDYNKEYTDLHNYQIQTYKNWFLGSYGKKVGTYFTWHGADDIDLITPSFPTDLTEILPQKKQERTGTFEETMLYMNRMEKDYYHQNSYATYSGGDFRLQVIHNHMNSNGKKVLVLRNSFACVVTPFLALQTAELHVIDDREGNYPSGKIVDVEQYITELKPDYVIMLKREDIV